MTSTEALELPDIPQTLLVVGGGYIGMKLGAVYATVGSRVVVAEALEALLTGADPDLARPVVAYAKKAFQEIRLQAKVLSTATQGHQPKVEMEVAGQRLEQLYDRVLVAVGRVPNCDNLGLENTKVKQDEKGFILVDEHQRTDAPEDIVGHRRLTKEEEGSKRGQRGVS